MCTHWIIEMPLEINDNLRITRNFNFLFKLNFKKEKKIKCNWKEINWLQNTFTLWASSSNGLKLWERCWAGFVCFIYISVQLWSLFVGSIINRLKKKKNLRIFIHILNLRLSNFHRKNRNKIWWYWNLVDSRFSSYLTLSY